jgi:hypothetical protein
MIRPEAGGVRIVCAPSVVQTARLHGIIASVPTLMFAVIASPQILILNFAGN